jgi:hypothetical protein
MTEQESQRKSCINFLISLCSMYKSNDLEPEPRRFFSSGPEQNQNDAAPQPW